MSTEVSNPSVLADGLQALEDQQASNEAELDELQSTRESLEHGQTAAEEKQPEGFAMTPERRIGSTQVEYDGEMHAFGRMNGRASVKLADHLDTAGGRATDHGEWLWATLAEWSLSDDKDLDYWADGFALVDCIQLTRQLALGGNAR